MPSTPSTAAPLAAPPLVPAVVRAAAVMDTLARARQPMSMARLASALGLPRSSMHGLCHTLVSLGLLRRDVDGQLAIGPRVMGLAEAFVASTDVAREFNALWQTRGEQPEDTVLLSVLDGRDVVYLAARNGTRPLGLAFTVGMHLPAHLTATGLAMLAFSDPELVRQTLAAAPLERLTARGCDDLSALLRELDLVRERGYSIDDEGVRLGVYGLAAPVLDASGRAVAGVGMCLNKVMLTPEDIARQREWVLATAQALTQRLGGQPLDPSTAPGLLPGPSPKRRARAGALT